MPFRVKNILRKIFKVFAWTMVSIVLLLVVVALLIQIPAVQLKLTQKAVSIVEEKIGTEVTLEGIRVGFPKSIVLEGLYLEDQQGDTLLYAGKLSVDTDLWALTRNEIQLNDIHLENSAAFISRPESDSAFNFTYIIDAFAGDSTAVPDTLEQKGWNFSLETIKLERIRLQYRDLLLGNIANLSLGVFELDMDEFDLGNNVYGVKDILLADARASFEQTKLPLPPAMKDTAATDSSAALIFSMDELNLENVHLSYQQSALGQVMRLDLGEAQVLAEKIDLENQDIDLNTVALSKTFLAYHQNEGDTVLEVAPKKENGTAGESEPWKFTLRNLSFADNSIQFLDLTKSHRKGSVDFDHLWLTGFNIDARDIQYDPSAIRADVRNISFREQSGFALKTMKGDINVSETEAAVTNFLMETGNSRLTLEASAEFASLRDIGETYPEAKIASTIHDSFISLKDILYFKPDLRDSLPLNLTSGTNLTLDASVTGSVNDLAIRHLILSTFSETHLKASGKIAGLPETKGLRMNLKLDKFYTTRADVETIVPDTLLPDSLQLPVWVNLEGGFKGSLEKAAFTSFLTSADGAIDIKGEMNLDSASALRGLDAHILVSDLDVGNILGKPDSVMGTLAMRADVHTAGLSPNEMNGTLKAIINKFEYKGYAYTDLQLDGIIRDQIVSVTAAMTDKNLDFTLNAGYDFQEAVPHYDVLFDLKNADFKALNLSHSAIRARGTLLVNMATPDFQILNGNVGIRKVAVYNGDKLYAVDSLLFASIDQEGRSEINIDSDLLAAKFEGSINLFALPTVMREYFHTYYSLHDSLEVQDAPSQRFSFEIKLKNTELLTDLLVPNLTSFKPGEIKGEFDSETKVLDLKMAINEIQYANIGIDSFMFSTNSDARSLNYNFMADMIMIDSMKIDGLEFNGTVSNDSIRTDLIILDSADTKKYVLAGTMFSLEKGFELRLLPEAIVLNYQNWSVPVNNYMRFGGQKFVAENVELANIREKIIIESKPQPGTPILIGFRELNLEYLSSMIADERPLSGLLHGDINFYPDTAGMTFTSDITIGDFTLQDIPWGDIALHVEQTVRDRFDVDFELTSAQNNIALNGFYTGGKSPAMDLLLKINQFNLVSLQPLLKDQLQDLKGEVMGEIAVKGSPEIPDIDGRLTFNNASFLSNYLNTPFSIGRETISFIEEGISFDEFEIADNNDHKARIDGTIRTRTYRDFEFNLDLVTDHFRLFNTTSEDNELFYGTVDIEAEARIRGNMTTPVVNMNIGLSEGSDFTYVVPQSEASAMESQGIVKFVDKTFKGDPFMDRVDQELADTVKSTFRGIDLTARVELSDQETFTIIIDPLTGDQLSVKGNATLTLQVDPTGDMQLAGRYEISEGTYNLSFYKFVKREFQIEKGSTIVWSGDPMNAEMDIRAIYSVETSPMELFSNQLTGSDATEVNQYKQRLPFLVYLSITGLLLQPEIAFELDMPIDERNYMGGNIYARLQDINTRESDLNKQVFALLILKRFISDNPFENEGAGGFESTARRSVSKILSEQLNRLSENIKGVELSFDIKSYEDYSSGQAQGQTELQLGLSKSFLDDRLVVKLSGNIDIEGQNTQRDATDYIGDLAIEYKITPDGRFRITGFRNSNYDMIDGELTETGAGLIYVKDYNSLSELFKANAETKN